MSIKPTIYRKRDTNKVTFKGVKYFKTENISVADSLYCTCIIVKFAPRLKENSTNCLYSPTFVFIPEYLA